MKYNCFICCTVLCLFIILAIYSTSSDIKSIEVTQQMLFRVYTVKSDFNKIINTTHSSKLKSMKYILLWTSESEVNIPLVYMGEGQAGFLTRNCTYVNCFVTADKTLLGSESKFDAIVFPGPELEDMTFEDNYLPIKRSVHQKYVFASIESAANYDIATNRFDEYFNWTWTYKLDSDIRWGYIVIRDLNNNIIGPRTDMNWLKLGKMDPVTEDFKQGLKTKKRAAAWFASNCHSESRRERFVKDLKKELLKHKHFLDVYGDCGIHVCSRKNERVCDEKIAKNYYFYLSFENAFSEDYVTEKLLRPLKYNAVPVVYGGANYTRFMPDGIYLNALDLGVKKLAAKINKLIEHPEEYANYFRWKNHYKYEKTTDSVDTNEYCKMCAILNDEKAVKKTTVYGNFRQWWNQRKTDADLFESKLSLALHS